MTAPIVVIEDVLVVDASHPAGERATVEIRGELIFEVRAPGGDVPDGATVIDGRGRTLVPGLIDAHFHAYASEFDGFGIDSSPTSFVALQAGRKLGDALRRGFTTVRDVAGGDHGLRRAIERGVFDAPDYFYTGPALSQTGGHGDSHHPGVEACAGHQHMGVVVDGPVEIRRTIRSHLRDGAHAIKVMASGGVASHSDPLHVSQFSHEELAAAVDEAQRFGTYVTAHAYTSDAVQRAIAAGIAGIEHGNLIDAETIDLMVEADTTLVPTLIAYEAMDRRGARVGMSDDNRRKNAVVLEKGRAATRLAADRGVRVGFGTDLMGDLDDEQLAGFRIHVEVLGVARAIVSATAVNAGIMGLDDRGRVEPGLRADLVLREGNVLEHPEVMWTEDAERVVLRAGRDIRTTGPEYQRTG
ncbi:amidohydrolase family protein [Microbacterium sp. NPDC057650]|uniref:metal-dependent hydrolase family protein n=1 Tax=unclassified Microbacterium TaxID=2609290 RepID=UPI00366C76B4